MITVRTKNYKLEDISFLYDVLNDGALIALNSCDLDCCECPINNACRDIHLVLRYLEEEFDRKRPKPKKLPKNTSCNFYSDLL